MLELISAALGVFALFAFPFIRDLTVVRARPNSHWCFSVDGGILGDGPATLLEWAVAGSSSCAEELVVQKHAIALGYFFLAVFCVFVSAHAFLWLRLSLLLAALFSALAGLGYLASACGVPSRITGAKKWLADKKWLRDLIRVARQPPAHLPDATDTRRT